MSIAARLKYLRKTLLKKKLKEIAEDLKISIPSWTGYEAGKFVPDYIILLISLTYGIDFDWIKDGTGNIYSEENDSTFNNTVNELMNECRSLSDINLSAENKTIIQAVLQSCLDFIKKTNSN